jgi:hypothetical protein
MVSGTNAVKSMEVRVFFWARENIPPKDGAEYSSVSAAFFEPHAVRLILAITRFRVQFRAGLNILLTVRPF